MKRFVFTGGGTGGHIFPGIAVAEALDDVEIIWIGAKKGPDKKFVESGNLGIKFYGIAAGKLRRYFSFDNLIDIFKIIIGFIQSCILLFRIKPDLIFSKGGFVSVPPCIAGKLLGIPVITHECDFSPGLATKINARVASHILVSYPETATILGTRFSNKAICMGNPVRLRFYTADPVEGRKFTGCSEIKPILFVIGGSLGATQINDLVKNNIQFLCEHFFVVHQLGGNNMAQADDIKNIIISENKDLLEFYKPYDFIVNEMPNVLSSSYLVLSRAGANIVWESAAAGKPMVLVPLDTGSSRGDQLENAEFFKLHNAAFVLNGKTVTDTEFKKVMLRFITDIDFRKSMAKASATLAIDKPAQKIANFLIDISN